MSSIHRQAAEQFPVSLPTVIKYVKAKATTVVPELRAAKGVTDTCEKCLERDSLVEGLRRVAELAGDEAEEFLEGFITRMSRGLVDDLSRGERDACSVSSFPRWSRKSFTGSMVCCSTSTSVGPCETISTR